MPTVKPLVEGRDFYFNDEGLMVLTRDYHLKRGSCCRSVCKECPFNSTKIISMVPSWTETLLEAGAKVVARTRFCIHPREKIKKIKAVGGTKDINWHQIPEADLLLLDREENPKSMQDESVTLPKLRVLDTHVSDIREVASELDKIALALAEDSAADQLRLQAVRWRTVLNSPCPRISNWNDLPGVVEWVRKPESLEVSNFVYVIWKNPWMIVGRDTFIASMLEAVGLKRPSHAERYPELNLESLPEETVLLCSTEPFPFASEKHKQELLKLNRPVALVDGEKFSWFGIRSLQFLESLKI